MLVFYIISFMSQYAAVIKSERARGNKAVCIMCFLGWACGEVGGSVRDCPICGNMTGFKIQDYFVISSEKFSIHQSIISSIQNGIYALGRAHMNCTSLRNFHRHAFESVPKFSRLMNYYCIIVIYQQITRAIATAVIRKCLTRLHVANPVVSP